MRGPSSVPGALAKLGGAVLSLPLRAPLVHAARRPAVILRKNSYANRSQKGAATQAVLMSVYRTLKLRGLNPTQTIAAALQTYLTTGKLPALPAPAIANG